MTRAEMLKMYEEIQKRPRSGIATIYPTDEEWAKWEAEFANRDKMKEQERQTKRAK